MPLINKYRFQIWVWEICHGATPFMNRSLMLESCAGITEFDSWEELGRMLDKGISVDGQKISRVVNIGDMRSTGEFYDMIGNAHKAGKHDHPTYHLPEVPSPGAATPSGAAVVEHTVPVSRAPEPVRGGQYPFPVLSARQAANPFTPFFEKHKHEGSTYQPALRTFLIEHPEIKLMVETGSGCSTCYFTMAMEERGGAGHLHSIDPKPWCDYSVEHARVTNIRQMSVDAMLSLYLRTGPWDLFLHDGNHDLFHQAFDIEVGYAFVRPGGWIWCDDYTWGEHHAWKRFAASRRLALHDFGSASAIQKPMNDQALLPGLATKFVADVIARLTTEADAWRKAGHEDSAVFANR